MSTPDSHSLVEIGRFDQLASAREAALALAAKDLAFSIERENEEWLIRVESPVAETARVELESYVAEERSRVGPPDPSPFGPFRTAHLFVAGWILCGFFFAQQMFGEAWTRKGAAVSRDILRGEWWRTVTALTLHGDLPHLVANLVTGLLFAAFLQPQLGVGMTWLLILASGILGNAVNAWGYRGEAHASIGASTAVFGALGLLVGAELWTRWSHPHTRGRWSLVVPLGAGLALLAYLGVGDERKQIDIMAHWWGFAAGLLLGIFATAFRLRERSPRWLQRLAGIIALVLPPAVWVFATN